MAPLFTPYQLGTLSLPNRFAMAPMTRRFSPGGVPGDDVAAYYARRAPHVGLLITEGTYVGQESAGSSDRVPRFHGEYALAGWAKVVTAVHAAGGRIIPQLWHLGAAREAGAPPYPHAPVLSPSGLSVAGDRVGEPASITQLDDVIEAFARAARDAQRLGFDGVELHGAHGYLLDQFLWTVTNRRTDRYGDDSGSPEGRQGRIRLAAEVIAAVRAATSPDFPVILRWSQWKGGVYDARIADSPTELEQLLTPLADAGLTAFHVSTRRYWLPAFDGDSRTLAGWTKHLTGLPAIAVGSVGVPKAFHGEEEPRAEVSLAPLVRLLEAGELDLVALGRALLSDPEWTRKVRDGQTSQIRWHERGHARQLW